MNTALFSDIFSQIVSQTVLGYLGGSILDQLFPSSSSVVDSNILKVTIESLAQLAVNGFITFYGFDMLLRRGLVSSVDPTKNFAYLITSFSS